MTYVRHGSLVLAVRPEGVFRVPDGEASRRAGSGKSDTANRERTLDAPPATLGGMVLVGASAFKPSVAPLTPPTRHRLPALIHGRWLMIEGMVAGGRCLGGKQSSDHPRTDQEAKNVDQDDICAVRCHCSEHRRYRIGCDQETKSPSQRPTGSGHRSARRPSFQSLQSRSHRRWYPWLQSNARALLNCLCHTCVKLTSTKTEINGWRLSATSKIRAQ